MERYRTQIVVPADRTVILQLPPDVPEGPATLIIRVDPPPEPAPAPERDAPLDHQDIEWFDEHDEGPDADAPARHEAR